MELLLLTVLAILMDFPASAGDKRWLVIPETIVFQSDRDGNDEIYSSNPQGGQLRRLTANSSRDEHPRLSPDRTKVVFSSDRDGNSEIYLMDVSGQNQKRLTHHPALDQQPSWSRDGQRIIFCSARDGSGNLWSIKPDGSGLEQITRYERSWCGTPVFSPDGKKIAMTFKSARGRRWRAAMLELKNFKLTKISPAAPGNCRPAWSPNGERIVFVQHVSRTNTELWLYDLNSGEFTRLTHHPAKDYNPVFSPDGKQILFQSARDTGREQLYLLDLQDLTVRRVSSSEGNDQNPDWK